MGKRSKLKVENCKVMVNLIKHTIEEFAREMSRRKYERATWTARLFDAMLALGHRAGCRVACSCKGADAPEWLYDQTWLVLENDLGMRLRSVEFAMESEWTPDFAEVMQDFNKLLQSRAKIKVMVCSRCSYDLSTFFQEAVARYPGAEECTYIFAECDFSNPTMPVSVSICDARGQMRFTDRISALQRYLQSAGSESIHLAFEGFWPNRKSEFITDHNGFYFVFAGVRKQTSTGYVAELRRLLFIGVAAEIAPRVVGEPNAFERYCGPGEIPYFAFAEISGSEVLLEHVFAALIYHFQPVINRTQGVLVQPEEPVRFVMTGAVAECLGEREFLV